MGRRGIAEVMLVIKQMLEEKKTLEVIMNYINVSLKISLNLFLKIKTFLLHSPLTAPPIQASFVVSQLLSLRTVATNFQDQRRRSLPTNSKLPVSGISRSCCNATLTMSCRGSFSASMRFKTSLQIGNIRRVSHKKMKFLENCFKFKKFSGLLNSTFEILYDNDVLSLEAFEKWKNDSENQQGKGKEIKNCFKSLFLILNCFSKKASLSVVRGNSSPNSKRIKTTMTAITVKRARMAIRCETPRRERTKV